MCLQVCCQWRERVSSFDSFWRRRCLQYGLPDYHIQEEEEEEEEEGERGTRPVELVRLAYRQRRCISQSRGSLVLHEVPGWGKEEDVHSFGCYGAGSGVVLEMLCRKVIFKTSQSFSILTSDGGEKNFVFRGIGIHIFDQSQGCFKPVTIVMPLIKVCEPRIIFSRASMDQSWVMIVLFDDHFVEGFSLHKVFLSSSSSSSSSCSSSSPSPSNSNVTITSVKLTFPSKVTLLDPQFPIDCCPKCGSLTIADWHKNTITVIDSNCTTQPEHYVTVSLQTQYSHFIIPDQSPSATCASHSFLVACSMEQGLPLYTDLETPPSMFLPVPESLFLPNLILSDDHRLAACPSEDGMKYVLWDLSKKVLLVTVNLRIRQSFSFSYMSRRQHGCVVVSPGLVYSLVVHGNHLMLVCNKTGQVRLMHQQPLRRSLMTLLGNTEASQLVVLRSDWLSDVRQICKRNCPFVLFSLSKGTFPVILNHITF